MGKLRMTALAVAALCGLLWVAVQAEPAAADDWKTMDEASLVKWVDEQSQWQSLGPEDKVLLARRLKAAGVPAKAARVKLAENLAAAYLSDPAKTRSVAVSRWKQAVGFLGDDLTAEARGQWAGKLRAAFIDDQESLRKLGFPEARYLGEAFELLGAGQHPAPVAVWVEKTSGWVALPLPALQSLAKGLAAAGDDGKAARGRLIGYLEASYLSEPAKTRQVGTGAWREFAEKLSGELTAQKKAEWAGKIRSAYTADAAALGGMKSYWSAEYLADALKSLGDAQPGTVMAQWAEKSPAFESVFDARDKSLAALEMLIDQLNALGEGGAAARQRVVSSVTGRYLADKEKTRSLSSARWASLAKSLVGDMSEETRVLWAGKLREAFGQDYKEPGRYTAADTARNLLEALRALKGSGT